MLQKNNFGVRIPVVALNSGHNMPFIAMGTTSSKIPYPSNEEFKIFILEAIKVGYRHIDTAAMYGSEEGVGLAVEEALKTRLVKSRDELFVTTKLGYNNARPDCVPPAITESLRKLGLEYVDLYLIHAPVTISSATHVSDMTLKKGDISPMDIESVWTAMEEEHKIGLAKSIGVSNFTCKKLTELLAHAKIIPAVNQNVAEFLGFLGNFVLFQKNSGLIGFLCEPRVNWCVFGCLVDVGIGSKHGDASWGVENPSSDAFCQRHRGDAVSIPTRGDAVSILTHGVTHVRFGQGIRGTRCKDGAKTNEVTVSLTHVLDNETSFPCRGDAVQVIGRHGISTACHCSLG
ncbi:hypothetical protein Sjap_023991 [Stephania japonica]|uniref:NADP-dependent oxidoreductase domain-containing protein n=1 Tax=Stephania japonica TaxID=461633 RepID=A0AAP0ECS1_9MAGN